MTKGDFKARYQQLYKWCKRGDRVESLFERGRRGVIVEAPNESPIVDHGQAVAEWEDGTQWWVDPDDVKHTK